MINIIIIVAYDAYFESSSPEKLSRNMLRQRHAQALIPTPCISLPTIKVLISIASFQERLISLVDQLENLDDQGSERLFIGEAVLVVAFDAVGVPDEC